jgi:hypothetical protein
MVPYMRYNNHTIFREMEICFDSMRSHIYSTPERGHGILGIHGFVATMCDALGPLAFGNGKWSLRIISNVGIGGHITSGDKPGVAPKFPDNKGCDSAIFAPYTGR